MIKDDKLYLRHILENLEKALRYSENLNYESFLKNEEKQDAVIRKIEVAGEAAKKLSSAFKEKYHAVPWRAIAGMRDKLIHNYFEIDIETIRLTLQEDIPEVLHVLKEILDEMEKD